MQRPFLKYRAVSILVIFLQIASLITTTIFALQPTPEMVQVVAENIGLSHDFATRLAAGIEATQPLFGKPKTALAAINGLKLNYITTGTPFTLVGDAKGSPGGSYTLTVNKPLNVTNVLKAFVITADIPVNPPPTLPRPTVMISGTSPSWTAPRCFSGWCSRYADITSLVQSTITGSAAETLNFDVIEVGDFGGTDGVGILILFDDPLGSLTSFAFFSGGQAQSGDSFTLRLTQPWDDQAGKTLQMGFGISFSQGVFTGQTSQVKMNGTTISDIAGGYDDGGFNVGELY